MKKNSILLAMLLVGLAIPTYPSTKKETPATKTDKTSLKTLVKNIRDFMPVLKGISEIGVLMLPIIGLEGVGEAINILTDTMQDLTEELNKEKPNVLTITELVAKSQKAAQLIMDDLNPLMHKLVRPLVWLSPLIAKITKKDTIKITTYTGEGENRKKEIKEVPLKDAINSLANRMVDDLTKLIVFPHTVIEKFATTVVEQSKKLEERIQIEREIKEIEDRLKESRKGAEIKETTEKKELSEEERKKIISEMGLEDLEKHLEKLKKLREKTEPSEEPSSIEKKVIAPAPVAVD